MQLMEREKERFVPKALWEHCVLSLEIGFSWLKAINLDLVYKNDFRKPVPFVVKVWREKQM